MTNIIFLIQPESKQVLQQPEEGDDDKLDLHQNDTEIYEDSLENSQTTQQNQKVYNQVLDKLQPIVKNSNQAIHSNQSSQDTFQQLSNLISTNNNTSFEKAINKQNEKIQVIKDSSPAVQISKSPPRVQINNQQQQVKKKVSVLEEKNQVHEYTQLTYYSQQESLRNHNFDGRGQFQNKLNQKLNQQKFQNNEPSSHNNYKAQNQYLSNNQFNQNMNNNNNNQNQKINEQKNNNNQQTKFQQFQQQRVNSQICSQEQNTQVQPKKFDNPTANNQIQNGYFMNRIPPQNQNTNPSYSIFMTLNKNNFNLHQSPTLINCNISGKQSKAKAGQVTSPIKADEKKFDDYLLPYFVRKENLKDINQRRPNDPNYDKTTIFISQADWQSLTPTQKQYWEIKQKNFDKIVFFKLGKFYEIFDNDAEICHRLLDLNYMTNQRKQLHVGFPEKCKDQYAEVLTQHGHTVIVVEQTIQSSSEKAKNQNWRFGDKTCVPRAVCQIYSRGTMNNLDYQTYESKYVLTVKREEYQIGVCFFDISINKCHIGLFEDDSNYNTFRTTLSQIRAVEIVVERGQIPEQMEKMIKSSPINPILHQYRGEQCPNAQRTNSIFDRYIHEAQKQDSSQKDSISQHILEQEVFQKIRNDSRFSLGLQAFGMAIRFLESHLLASQCLRLFEYQLYQPNSQEYLSDFMVLDSQAIEHLELIEQVKPQIQRRFSKENQNDLDVNLATPPSQTTLFDFINHTKTEFGCRLLKKWLLAPLIDIDKINDRLDAIEDLTKNFKYLDEFRQNISRMPDIERILSQVYRYSVHKSNQNTQGLIPNIKYLLEEFAFLIVWKQVPGSQEQIPEPKKGLCKEFDDYNQQIFQIKDQMEKYLDTLRQKVKSANNGKYQNLVTQIGYSHTKYRYEIEIPKELVSDNKRLKELEFTSTRNGFERFHTQELKRMIEELEECEESLQNTLSPFIYALFQRFYQSKGMWDATVSVLAELDCLASLAMASSNGATTQMCRPEFLQHPCVNFKQDINGKARKEFVPNDTIINDPNTNARVLLVTGPNMGGKSTLLRQTCLGVILAQIGCYVPASKCKLTPVDRIFTRLGASDRILEGKSTFFVEMEETNTILLQATFKSLAIVDELGRGTSTFDGYSIAHAVLNFLVKNIRCRSLFSTHYHMLLDKFRNVEGVQSYHMACKQNEHEQDKIIFLYKFIKGDCPESFGMNVARMAGLPNRVVDRAKLKSKDFVKKMQRMLQFGQSYNKKYFNETIKSNDTNGYPQYSINSSILKDRSSFQSCNKYNSQNNEDDDDDKCDSETASQDKLKQTQSHEINDGNEDFNQIAIINDQQSNSEIMSQLEIDQEMIEYEDNASQNDSQIVDSQIRNNLQQQQQYQSVSKFNNQRAALGSKSQVEYNKRYN
ncbi:dna mismatch repair protein msh6 [Stylonychia lemnae]|uniref:DNA mismatch repair protein n=1 Tax=Stylonychia lemnae TaxID=5949 RepID=A0A077ZR67_STYLE|nr:dna mismatch repair protein msh6 [Stylonychia lemnae]|eukprot:CDW72387.1 dna mismatch repair protein msh6 [Stylonychia lemnae]